MKEPNNNINTMLSIFLFINVSHIAAFILTNLPMLIRTGFVFFGFFGDFGLNVDAHSAAEIE